MALPPESTALPARGWRIDPRKAIAVSATFWAGFGLIVWLVTTGRSGTFDNLGLVFWRTSDLAPRGPELLLEWVRDLTALGGVLLRNLIALGVVVALAFLRLRREAALLALTVMLGWLVGWGIKLLVGRPRPEIVPHLTEAGGASFPSGHSFNAAVVYIAIALALATLSARESVRLTIISAALLLSLAVAWSRVWLGVHFPTDVAAGWLGGAGWAFLAAAVLWPSANKMADSTTAAGTSKTEARR
jgi:undecaprenyl-diphosphatase